LGGKANIKSKKLRNGSNEEIMLFFKRMKKKIAMKLIKERKVIAVTAVILMRKGEQ